MALVYPISQFYLCTELKILFLWTLLIVFYLKSATCNIFDIWGCRYLSKTTRFRKEP